MRLLDEKMPRRRRDDDEESPFAVRLTEQLRIDLVAELPAGRMLCNTVGRGQFPRAYVAAHPEATAVCWFLDVYQRDQTASAPKPPASAEVAAASRAATLTRHSTEGATPSASGQEHPRRARSSSWSRASSRL